MKKDWKIKLQQGVPTKIVLIFVERQGLEPMGDETFSKHDYWILDNNKVLGVDYGNGEWEHQKYKLFYLPKDWVALEAYIWSDHPNLPEINGVKGTIEDDMVMYGCAMFNIDHLQDIVSVSNHNLGGNRSIKSITFTSDVTMTMIQIKEIISEYENKNKST